MRMNARASVMLVAAVWLAAAEPVAAQRGTPLEQATELAKAAKAAREPADRIAARIASTLRLGGEDVLRAIRAGGYRAEEAALATSAALAMSVEDGIASLVGVGYGRVESARWFGQQGRGATAIVSGLRRTGANARQATADLVELGFGCSDVAVGMHAAGYDATEIYTALGPQTQPPTPGPNPPPPGTPHIASFRVNQDDPIAYSREIDIAWDITGCAATHVRVSEQASFAGATWRSLGQAHSLADVFPGASTYSLDPDTPGQKTIHIQFRNAAGEGALASASVEYRRLLSITDVRLNQNATETNNRALEVDVAIDGAAPTHIRMAEQNIEQEPWQAFGDMFAFNPSPSFHGSNYPITRTYLLESPDFGMKTVWVQLMRDDENTVSDPVSAQIEYRMRPRFLSIEPRVFNNRKPATLTIEVTGLSADIGNIVNARMVAGMSYCGFYEYNSALGEALITYAGGVVTDPERVVAQSVTSLDDETFRFTFYGIFNVQDRAQTGCKLGLNAQLVGLDGQSLGGLSVYEGDALVQIIQPEPREEIVVENTYDLLPYLEISDANIVNSNSFGLCDGTLVGPAGSFPVGVLNAGGDLALVTRSAPSGTTCDRTISAPTLRGGWRMDIEFAEETSGTVCAVSRDGTPKDGRPTKFAFNRLVTFVGWEKVGNAFGNGYTGTNGSYTWKSANVFITCSPSFSNDHEARSVLKRVIIHVPDDAPENVTFQDAFSG